MMIVLGAGADLRGLVEATAAQKLGVGLDPPPFFPLVLPGNPALCPFHFADCIKMGVFQMTW